MKKNIIALLIITGILLTACGSAGVEVNSIPISDVPQGGRNAEETPLSTTLAVGTLKLEETNFAVDSDQASNLLPLWQVLRSLTESDSAAQEEITAIVKQIQETMTPDQLQAINNMNLTGENLFTVMQEMDLAPQFTAEGSGRPSGDNFGGGQGVPGSGRPGAGGGPGGGFGGDSGQLSPEQIATAQARRTENGGGGLRSSNLIAPLTEVVIALLESK
jgi:hypothetical protein